jgi:hypothetical protein
MFNIQNYYFFSACELSVTNLLAEDRDARAQRLLFIIVQN